MGVGIQLQAPLHPQQRFPLAIGQAHALLADLCHLDSAAKKFGQIGQLLLVRLARLPR